MSKQWTTPRNQTIVFNTDCDKTHFYKHGITMDLSNLQKFNHKNIEFHIAQIHASDPDFVKCIVFCKGNSVTAQFVCSNGD